MSFHFILLQSFIECISTPSFSQKDSQSILQNGCWIGPCPQAYNLVFITRHTRNMGSGGRREQQANLPSMLLKSVVAGKCELLLATMWLVIVWPLPKLLYSSIGLLWIVKKLKDWGLWNMDFSYWTLWSWDYLGSWPHRGQHWKGQFTSSTSLLLLNTSKKRLREELTLPLFSFN